MGSLKDELKKLGLTASVPAPRSKREAPIPRRPSSKPEDRSLARPTSKSSPKPTPAVPVTPTPTSTPAPATDRPQRSHFQFDRRGERIDERQHFGHQRLSRAAQGPARDESDDNRGNWSGPRRSPQSNGGGAETSLKQSSFCGSCQKVLPDVEFYEHNIRKLNSNWLCCVCADQYKVPDICRKTNQSDVSKRGLFRREYGATKRHF